MDANPWILELIKTSPAIAALVAVIFFLYKIILAKDESTKELVKASQGDIERQTKIIALLEVLVQTHTPSKGGGG